MYVFKIHYCTLVSVRVHDYETCGQSLVRGLKSLRLLTDILTPVYETQFPSSVTHTSFNI